MHINLITDTCLGVIRFTSPDVDGLTVPYSPAMGGGVTDAPPFTGNGFLASAVDIIPEFKCPGSLSLKDGAELIVIQKDGAISVIAEFSSDAGRFIPIN